jgi:hypothetical protein
MRMIEGLIAVQDADGIITSLEDGSGEVLAEMDFPVDDCLRYVPPGAHQVVRRAYAEASLHNERVRREIRVEERLGQGESKDERALWEAEYRAMQGF